MINFLNSQIVLTLNTLLTIFLFIKNIKEIYYYFKSVRISYLTVICVENVLIIEFYLLNYMKDCLFFTNCKLGNLEPDNLKGLDEDEICTWLDAINGTDTQPELFKKLDKIYKNKSYIYLTKPMYPSIVVPFENRRFHFVFNNVDKDNIPKALTLDLGLKNIKIPIKLTQCVS